MPSRSRTYPSTRKRRRYSSVSKIFTTFLAVLLANLTTFSPGKHLLFSWNCSFNRGLWSLKRFFSWGSLSWRSRLTMHSQFINSVELKIADRWFTIRSLWRLTSNLQQCRIRYQFFLTFFHLTLCLGALAKGSGYLIKSC